MGWSKKRRANTTKYGIKLERTAEACKKTSNLKVSIVTILVRLGGIFQKQYRKDVAVGLTGRRVGRVVERRAALPRPLEVQTMKPDR